MAGVRAKTTIGCPRPFGSHRETTMALGSKPVKLLPKRRFLRHPTTTTVAVTVIGLAGGRGCCCRWSGDGEGGGGRSKTKVTNHFPIYFILRVHTRPRGPKGECSLIRERTGQCGSNDKSIKPTDDYNGDKQTSENNNNNNKKLIKHVRISLAACVRRVPLCM